MRRTRAEWRCRYHASQQGRGMPPPRQPLPLWRHSHGPLHQDFYSTWLIQLSPESASHSLKPRVFYSPVSRPAPAPIGGERMPERSEQQEFEQSQVQRRSAGGVGGLRHSHEIGVLSRPTRSKLHRPRLISSTAATRRSISSSVV